MAKQPRTALFLSPHLDDAAFSCGGLAANLADAGWRTVLATAFTRSVVPATGFALACQLDKGLPPDADYMALRRAEDRHAAAILGFSEHHWLDLPEAPHRGYASPSALFGQLRADDTILPELTQAFAAFCGPAPDLVLAPQGLGNHVDHQLVIAAAQARFPPQSLAFYRDTPYAIRQPQARPSPAIPGGLLLAINIAAALDRKIAAAQAYTTQIGFQFGGAQPTAAALASFAREEAAANRRSASSAPRTHCGLGPYPSPKRPHFPFAPFWCYRRPLPSHNVDA